MECQEEIERVPRDWDHKLDARRAFALAATCLDMRLWSPDEVGGWGDAAVTGGVIGSTLLACPFGRGTGRQRAVRNRPWKTRRTRSSLKLRG